MDQVIEQWDLAIKELNETRVQLEDVQNNADMQDALKQDKIDHLMKHVEDLKKNYNESSNQF